MKRITKRWGADQPRIAGRAICTFAGCPSEGGCDICNHARVNNHLADIEDILGDEYDLDRLRELAEADREGRCVVLERAKLEDIPFTYESLISKIIKSET